MSKYRHRLCGRLTVSKLVAFVDIGHNDTNTYLGSVSLIFSSKDQMT
jgi:hypothetical protein